MTRTIFHRTITSAILFSALLLGGMAVACDSAGPATHVGQLLSIDAEQQVFTIRDAETRAAITFNAGQEIITALQGFAGNLMVNYQQGDSGLTALGVTF